MKMLSEMDAHQFILKLMTVFYFVFNFDAKTLQRRITSWILYIVFSVGLPTTLLLGSIQNEDNSEALFLGALAITNIVITVRVLYARSEKQMLTLVQEINVKSMMVSKEIAVKLSFFKTFALYYVVSLIAGEFILSLVPIFSSDRRLPLNIWFPVDIQSNNISYSIAYAYLVSMTLVFGMIVNFSSVCVWYLLLNCSLMYHALGDRFRNMGVNSKSVSPKPNITFREELLECIGIHSRIRRNTDHFESIFSSLFFLQVTISGMSICGSIYMLAFSSSGNMFEITFFFVFIIFSMFDIFTVTYFGNEINMNSDRLSYCLFESNWIDQSESTKKLLIILVENVQRPQEVIAGKLYPLNLNTLTSVLNTAYRLFNVLRNM